MACSASFSPEHRVSHSWFSPWTPFRGIENQQLQWPWFNLRRCRWRVSVFSWQSPFLLINLTMIMRGALHDHFIPWCWEYPFSGKQATQCAVTGLGHKTVSKILWTTCLTSFLVQENIPSCCFLPYLELHCYHHWSHTGDEINIYWYIENQYILFY